VSRDSFKWGLIGSLIILFRHNNFFLRRMGKPILPRRGHSALFAGGITSGGRRGRCWLDSDAQAAWRLGRPVLACQLLFDIGVHGVGKIAMIFSNSIALVKDILLQEP